MTKKILYLVFALILASACIMGCVSTPGTTPTPTPTTTPSTITIPSTTPVPATTPVPTTTVTITTVPPTTTTPPAVDVYLVARNLAFNVSTITVPAGAEVNVHFDNQDTNIPHNFAAYQTSSAQQVIFKGDIITGSRQITYTFTAPSTPGNYFFRCDVHPATMTGTLRVI